MLKTNLLVLGVLAFAPAISAQEPEAEPAAKPAMKMPPVVEHVYALAKNPFECDFTIDMTAEGDSGAAKGHITFSSMKHFAMKVSVTEAAEEGEAPEPTKVTLLADGSHLIMHQAGGNVPPGQDKVAYKISLPLLETVLKSGGGGMIQGPEGMDLNQMMQLASKMQFTEKAVDKQTKRFSTTVDSSLIPQMGEEVLSISLDLQGERHFPKTMTVSSNEGTLTFQTTSVSFPESIAADKFQFKAPEGVQVMDVTAMLEAQLGALGYAEDEADF